ncbi:DUF5050 domain-containing protein [Tamlana sp. 2_MG-2023]|uniref:DUF5050 domain-containing protein n=1 Tax=unclassified Tamlana TaxID=2614803 RepID=UPI0026E29136|nr:MULTISPECIES: DUF5050 domain-containing protein [unclassified Tamlana]MDO6760819.1 DUF5050 domain-containing protein [Tamlana sp. 2_MG-2023]MDO6791075.1 DUF5050 domain-containing protein [Tamlana sp. 1_MG-2023]
MKNFKTLFFVSLVCILLTACNRNEPEYSGLPQEDIDVTTEYKWWILTHKNYQKPGIYLFNENTGMLEVELKLPKALQSPHALAYDGESLWVGGIGENESLYQLNPETGDIISEIPNIITEGIAIQDNFIYYSSENAIHKINKNGSFIETIETENTALTISDIAIDENSLYYLRYSETAPIVKLNLDSKSETPLETIETSGTYCLSFVDNKIITVSNLNEINQNNARTGEILSSAPTGFEGWITAIALYPIDIE